MEKGHGERDIVVEGQREGRREEWREEEEEAHCGGGLMRTGGSDAERSNQASTHLDEVPPVDEGGVSHDETMDALHVGLGSCYHPLLLQGIDLIVLTLRLV